MYASPLVGWLLVAVGTLTGLSCLLRPVRDRAASAAERRTARSEGLMGLGMALMAVPVHVLGPRPWGSVLFAVLFGIAALRSLRLARRGAHHLHHAVSAAAMAYMAVVMATAPTAAHGAMAGMDMSGGPAGVTAATGALMCYFAGYALWAGLRMLPAAEAAGAGALPVLRCPEMVAACRVSMGLGMLAMLLLM